MGTEHMTNHTHHPDKTSSTEVRQEPDNIIRCGGLLSISTTNELHEKLIIACQHKQAIVLDLADPERIDTAGVQLLCSFINYSKQNDIPFQWRNIPPALYATAALLGVEVLLELPPQ